MKLKQILSAFAFSLVSIGAVNAQGTTTCPAPNPGDPNCFQTSRPSLGNPLTNWPPIPNQDCCNAIPLCLPYNIIENNVVIPEGAPAGTLFPGCVENELPSEANTCFSNNEKGTTWFKFQIRPLNIPGSPTAVGAPAGKLRFKIIPKDVLDLPAYDPFTDDGSAGFGNTDYDFLLFKIPANLAGDGAACTAIRNSTTFTNSTSVIASCNWTGTRGPTGLFEPGQGTEFSTGTATRFNKPLDVKVGDLFYLAIDNFSVNTQGFDVDFRGLEAPDDQTAIVNPPPTDSIKIKTILNPVCASKEFTLTFDKPVRCDSVKPGKFIVTGLAPGIVITSITPFGGCNPGGQDTSFVFTISPDLPDTTLEINIAQDIRDICGNKVLLTSAKLRIEFPVPLVFGITGANPSCGITELKVQFAKKVYCDSVTKEKFLILNKGLPFGQVTKVRRANGGTCTPSTLDSLYIITFNKAIKDSLDNLQLALNGVVRDFCGNPVALDSIPFRINPFLTVTASPELVCPKRAVTLTAVLDSTFDAIDAEDSDNFLFEWKNLNTNTNMVEDDENTLVSNSKVLKIKRDPAVSETITYQLIATNLLNGCVDTSKVAVTYGASPAKEISLCPGDPLSFKPEFLSSLGTSCNYSWKWENYKDTSLVNGVIDTIRDLQILNTPGDIFLDSLVQNLVLTYNLKEDSLGSCTYILPVKAQICAPPNLVLTKGESVNNRVFRIRGISNGQYSIKIYNRWGKLVDEGDFPAEGWDPKSQNVVPGNYYYILTPKDTEKNKPFISWFQINAE